MVALVVVSVGMIGIAGLYGQGLSAGRTALYRTQAVNLAADMADRIRVNRLGGANYGGAGGQQQLRSAGRRELHARSDGGARFVRLDEPGARNSCRTVSAPCRSLGTSPPTYTITVNWQETGLGAVNYQMAIRVPNL